MKKLLDTNFATEGLNITSLLLRVGIAGLMLTHGLPKLSMLFADAPVQFPGVLGLSPEFSLGLTVFAEVLCSMLILLGFATRLAVIPLIITMLVAVFMIHANDPFANQEPGLQYLLVYVALLLLGSGKYSVDAVLAPRLTTK